MTDAQSKRWESRRAKYGERGHGSSYSRWTKDPYGARALQWVVEMHLEGTLSEGQCCQRLDMDRIDFRKLADGALGRQDEVVQPIRDEPISPSKGEALPVAVTDEMVEAAKANIASSRLRIPLHLHRDIDALVRHVTDLEVRCGAMKAVATAERERWLKAASKHVRADGRKSDCRERDLERARIAHRIEEGIAALSLPRPASDKGEEADVWARIGADDRLKRARQRLSLHELRMIVDHARARPSPGVSREEVARAYRVGDFIGRQPVLCEHGHTDPNNLCQKCEDGEPATLLSRGEG